MEVEPQLQYLAQDFHPWSRSHHSIATDFICGCGKDAGVSTDDEEKTIMQNNHTNWIIL